MEGAAENPVVDTTHRLTSCPVDGPSAEESCGGSPDGGVLGKGAIAGNSEMARGFLVRWGRPGQ